MQTDAPTTGLKACPFCGNPDLVVSLQPFIGGLSFGMVECEPCALTLREDDEEQAVARWNTRTPALETQGAHDAAVIEAAKGRSATDFEAGYLIAVANIMNLHGEDTVAEDVLRELGVKASILKGLGLSDYDLKPLRKLFREIERKSRYDRRALSSGKTVSAGEGER